MSGNSIFFGAGQAIDPTKYVELNYAEAQATTNTTTSSTTYTLLNAMTITPLAGTHQVWFSCSTSNTGTVLGTTKQDNLFSVFVDGVQVTHSERYIDSADDDVKTIAINCQVTTDGTQAVEVRWRTTGGTATCYERTMSMLKLADPA